MMAMTPMMEQYLEIKNRYRDAILMYRLGDFYEMFFDDAKVVSRELELTLTGRNCGDGERAPMCGVPFHSADNYIGRLVAKGYKVVVCEQMEDPATAKGLVKRDIVRVVTPGTVIDNTQLDESQNNYLCALCCEEGAAAMAFVDVSTGEMSATRFEGKDRLDRILNELGTFQPKELMVNCSLNDVPAVREYVRERLRAYVTEGQSERFDYTRALARVTRQFGTAASEAREKGPQVVSAIGALLEYITETQMTDVTNVSGLKLYDDGQYLELDLATRRNLELCETMRSKEKKGSLLWVLDRTKTSAGARMLRRWVEQPLVNAHKIGRRQRAVSELCSSFMAREELAEQLRHVLDLDRLMTKLVYGTANARDLRAIAATAALIPEIKELTADFVSEELSDIHLHLDTLSDIRELIETAIVEEPPFSLREGGFIRRGYRADADELYTIVHNGKSYIEKIAEEEREKTGIKNLKVAFNRVFGYYIEVTKSNLAEVPDRYIRKQTLVNAERFITEELKEKETLILGASDKLNALEYELFTEIRERIAAQVKRVQQAASLIAKLDCYVSLADAAVRNGWCCPEIEYGSVIAIKEGRHPVVEQFTSDGYFVPNDTLLDTNHNRLALITGPNMAGKSTYMRQVALIVLMAQIGSFVPAREARIGIVDKIFTRVGASDDLASGTSTFMLEMNEVAYILKNATRRSLIIYDEIGRGTSTFDGMSIARAVAEYTAGKKIGAKTMFATHYHELTVLEKEIEGVVNYNIAAKKKGDDITFLRKIVKGATDDSYGIEVAKLAGVPNDVIRRAKDVLRQLTETQAKPQRVVPEVNTNITFDDFKADEVREKLLNTDVNLLTPVEALNLLVELKQLAE
ncbi:MAG: DNA mismatch repair protein MutS [Ruminococcaceae bacterium]|nr:DNA mismatch repair protein MutS [Oscillospiraceae bacterium]